MALFGLGKSDNGYGETDRRLADDLRSAKSREQADKVARADGHKDARDAVNWLQMRS